MTITFTKNIRKFNDRAETLEELVAEIRFCEERAGNLEMTTRELRVQEGLYLKKVRAKLAKGEWGPWLHHNFGMTDRTARRYMTLAEKVEKLTLEAVLSMPIKEAYSKSDTLSVLKGIEEDGQDLEPAKPATPKNVVPFKQVTKGKAIKEPVGEDAAIFEAARIGIVQCVDEDFLTDFVRVVKEYGIEWILTIGASQAAE